MAQQDVTSMTMNAPSIGTPEAGSSGANCSAMDVLAEASFLSPAATGSRTPCFGTNTTDEFSPGHNHVASPTQSVDPTEADISTPPRSDASRDNNVTVTGVDLLDTQDTTANSNGVVGRGCACSSTFSKTKHAFSCDTSVAANIAQ